MSTDPALNPINNSFVVNGWSFTISNTSLTVTNRLSGPASFKSIPLPGELVFVAAFVVGETGGGDNVLSFLTLIVSSNLIFSLDWQFLEWGVCELEDSNHLGHSSQNDGGALITTKPSPILLTPTSLARDVLFVLLSVWESLDGSFLT